MHALRAPTSFGSNGTGKQQEKGEMIVNAEMTKGTRIEEAKCKLIAVAQSGEGRREEEKSHGRKAVFI